MARSRTVNPFRQLDNELAAYLRRLVALWLSLAEFPHMLTFLRITMTLMADPGAQVQDQLITWLGDALVGAFIPWWIKPLEWVSFHGVFAAIFLVVVARYRLWDPN